MTAEEARLELDRSFRFYGFRRPRGETRAPTSCDDWEWAALDHSGVRWCSGGCFCGSTAESFSDTTLVYDFDTGKLRRLQDVQFDER